MRPERDLLAERAWLVLVYVGFGAVAQTFFWGIVGPALMERLGIGASGFAAAIGTATLLAALSYLLLGPFVSRLPARVALAVSLLMTGFALSLAPLASGVAAFTLVFVLLRLGARHALTHAVEMRLSEERDRLGGFGAQLIALGYPLSILVVAPAVVAAAVFVRPDEILVVAGVATLAGGVVAVVLARQRVGAAPASGGTSSTGIGFATMLAEPRFLLLTLAYAVPFAIDTVALLFHTRLAPAIGSISLLSLYALGQIAGGVAGHRLMRWIGPGRLVLAQAPPLALGAGVLWLVGESAAPVFFAALGFSLALSNYAGVATWQATFGHDFLRTALVLRGVSTMAASAVAAAVAGLWLDAGGGMPALATITLGLVVVVAGCGVASARLGPRRDGAGSREASPA